mmetsp:Transcript_74716/g.211102  ORF Transcript_74716/g.211102 Transcript_74716/m.211102 type:complete len:213 (+) Transcript_74716:442-1080(+)
MKLSRPMGCQVESPRSRWKPRTAAPPASSSSSPSRTLPAAAPGLGATSGDIPRNCAGMPPLAFLPDVGVHPVWSEPRNWADAGEARASARGRRRPHCGPSASRSAPCGSGLFGGVLIGAAHCCSFGGDACRKSRPSPKHLALRNVRIRCARRGPSFFGTGPSSVGGASFLAPSPPACLVAAPQRCLLPGALPSARAWHSAAGLPTHAATCCQ